MASDHGKARQFSLYCPVKKVSVLTPDSVPITHLTEFTKHHAFFITACMYWLLYGLHMNEFFASLQVTSLELIKMFVLKLHVKGSNQRLKRKVTKRNRM